MRRQTTGPTDVFSRPARERLLTGIAHDLQSPLAAISGFASLLVGDWDDLPDDTKRQYVTSIDRQSRRLRRLVDELVTLAQIEAGLPAPSPERVSVAETVSEVARDYDLEIDAVTCPADLHVRVDPDHFARMLTNYLTNAARYGRPPIVVTAGADGDDHVTVEVRDHGQGVPVDFVPHLFDRRSRVSDDHGGSGLGLWIVQALAEANGGAASYRSVDGPGARFLLRLPAPVGG